MKNLYEQLSTDTQGLKAVAGLCNGAVGPAFNNLLRECAPFPGPFTLGEAAIRATLKQLEFLVANTAKPEAAAAVFPVTVVGIGKGDKTYYAAYDTATNVRGPLC